MENLNKIINSMVVLEIILVIIFSCAIIYCIIYNIKETKNINTIEEIKNKLNDLGLTYNHSLEITNNDSGIISYIRIYHIGYNVKNKKYYALAYVCDSKHQIGEWKDDVEVLYTIPNRCSIKDCGEWCPV